MSLLDFEVEFEPEREVWNVYEISDGTILRIKSLLVKLFRRDKADRPLETDGAYSGRFQSVMAVKRANPRLRGLGGRRLTPQEVLDRPKINEEFTALNEDWSSYRLETGDLLKVKMVATLVHRLEGVWDEFDDPIYAVSSVNVVQEMRGFHGSGAYDPGEGR